MAKHLLLGAAILCSISMSAENRLFSADRSGGLYLYEDFSSGKMPEFWTPGTACGHGGDKALYKNGLSDQGWAIEQVGMSGYCAVSATLFDCNADVIHETTLTSPLFEVKDAGAFLIWTAKSVYPDFPNSYRVEVLDSENVTEGWTTIATVTDESGAFRTRCFPLDRFVGKKIWVRFTADPGGYMLAIKDVSAGIPNEIRIEAENGIPAYAWYNADGISGEIAFTNVGRSLKFKSIGAYVDVTEIHSEPIDKEIPTGGEYRMKVTLPLKVNESTIYTVNGVSENGTLTEITEGNVFSSYFERTLFVDKGTGMWCNNCPSAILQVDALQRRYGKNIIVADTHVNDILAYESYWQRLKFYSVPYMMLNRNPATASSDTKYFDPELEAPVTAYVRYTSLEKGDKTATVKALISFYGKTDNSADRYRIGYTILRHEDSYPEELSKRFYQQNTYTLPRYEQYYFLPATIPAQLVKEHNVTIDATYAFDGIPNSLPAHIEAYTPVAWETTLSLPDGVDSFDDCTLAAFVLDMEDGGRILNAAAMDFANGLASIEEINEGESTEGPIEICLTGNGNFIVNGAERYTLEIHDIAGNLLLRETGKTGDSHSVNGAKGVLIVTATSDRSRASKLILR